MQEMDETIIATNDVHVRVLSLESKEVKPWHFHCEAVDNMFCLSGTAAVHLREPDEQVLLKSGQRVEVQPRRVHRVANLDDQVAIYLLVQGVGKFDFNIIDA